MTSPTWYRRWLPWTVLPLVLAIVGLVFVRFGLAQLLLMFAMSGHCRAIADRGPGMTSLHFYSCAREQLERLDGPLTRSNLLECLAEIAAAAGPDACGRPYRYAVSNQRDWGLVYSRGLADDYPLLNFYRAGWCGCVAVGISLDDYWDEFDLRAIDHRIAQLRSGQ
jgi:hypothetical protein